VTLVDQTASTFAYNPSSSPTGQAPVTGEQASGVIYLANDPNQTALNTSFSGGEMGAQLNILRSDTTAIQSTDPSMAPLAKLQQQLNAFADLFYNATTPTTFQAAYNNAATNPGELASNLFVISTATPTSPNDANNLEVNPALTSIVSPNAAIQTIKQASATAVTAALGQSLSFGGGTTNITATSGTLSQIATIIAADQSSRSSSAQTAATTASANLSTASTSYQGSTGVNLDQQLSLLVVLQNSYNAAAKIIGTVNSLQQALFAAVS
jgi:flagellar hook-associated protein FlgK